jgi:hypothetical protein
MKTKHYLGIAIISLGLIIKWISPTPTLLSLFNDNPYNSIGNFEEKEILVIQTKLIYVFGVHILQLLFVIGGIILLNDYKKD